MANTLNVSPALLRQLAHQFHVAAQHQDWLTIKKLDLQLRHVLITYSVSLKNPSIAPDVLNLKAAHHDAFIALETATEEMKNNLGSIRDQQDRANAYQLAMTMEY